MQDEEFHFKILKIFNETFKIFQHPFLKTFHESCNFHYYVTFKTMIKVYAISGRFIMLFMRDNRHFRFTYLLTDLGDILTFTYLK